MHILEFIIKYLQNDPETQDCLFVFVKNGSSSSGSQNQKLNSALTSEGQCEVEDTLISSIQ